MLLYVQSKFCALRHELNSFAESVLLKTSGTLR